MVNKTFKKVSNRKVTEFEARGQLSQAIFLKEKLRLAQRQITTGKVIAKSDVLEATRDT